jgi:hypothetical protein
MSAPGRPKREFPLGGTAAGKTACPAACRQAAASALACADGNDRSANRGAVRLGAKGAT